MLVLTNVISISSQYNYTDEEIKYIYNKAYVIAVQEAAPDKTKACGYICYRTNELCESIGVEGYFIVMLTHVIPVVQLNDGTYYGCQYQYLEQYTSYNRNWNNKTVYISGDFKYSKIGAAFITNRIIYDNNSKIFIDKIYINNLDELVKNRYG